MANQNDITGIPAPQPEDYDRQVSFTDKQIQNPNPRDFPQGSDLDAEFNAVERALDQTQARLRLIQRDDGALKNASVTRDALASDVIAGVNSPTTWAPFTQYAQTDSVIVYSQPGQNDPAWYVCEVAHVSSDTFTDDLAAGNWRLLVDLNTLLVDAGATEVSSATGTQTFTNALDSRTIPRDTVAQLRALPGAKPGLRVSWAGYYSAGDGGGNEGIVELRDGSADDGGSVFHLDDGVHQVRAVGIIDTPLKFGAAVSDSIDSTDAVRAYHSYCNSQGITAKYNNVSNLAINADAQIEVNTGVDYNGCVFHPLDGLVPDNDVSFSNPRYRMFVVVDPDTPLIEETVTMTLSKLTKLSINFADTIMPNGGYFRMKGDPSLHLVPNRQATEGVVIDIPFHIDCQGLATLPLPSDLSSGSTSRDIKRRDNSKKGRILLTNIVLNTKNANNQILIEVRRNGVTVDGVHEYLDGEQNFSRSICDYIRLSDVANVRVTNVTLPGPEADGATYVLNANGAADIYVDNYVSSGRHWGSATGNYINGIYYSNCFADRLDIHAAGYNFYVDNCRVNITCQYGFGGGTFRVSRTRLVGRDTNPFRALLSNRNDYGGHFEGVVEISDCETPDSLTPIVLSALGCDDLDIICPDIIIDGLHYTPINSGGFSSFDLLRATVTASKTGAVICPREIILQNVRGLSSNASIGMNLDLLSMEKAATVRPWSVFKISGVTTLNALRLNLNTAVKSVSVDPLLSLRIDNCGRVRVGIPDDVPVSASVISGCLVDDIDIPARSDLILANCYYSPHNVTTVIGRDTGGGYNIDVQGGVVKSLSTGGEVNFENVASLMGLVNRRFNTVFPAGVTESEAFSGWQR